MKKSKSVLAYERNLKLKEERLKRSSRFKGMSEKEVKRTVDIVSCDFFENKDTGYIGIVVPECPYCGNRHYHGTEQGVRLSHCSAHGFEGGPDNYDLQVDFTKPKNRKLKSRYEALVKKQNKSIM